MSTPQRQEICAALGELVLERGYPQVDLDAVLIHAGIDEETFNRYFRDVEDCFCAILAEGTEVLMQQAFAAFAAENGWRDQLRAVAYALLRFLQEDPKRARLMTVDVLSAGERAQLVRDQGIQALTEFIDQGRQQLDDPGKLTRATAEAIAGSIYNRIHLEIQEGRLASAAERVPELMYPAVLPYLGAEAAAEELTIPPPRRLDPAATEEERERISAAMVDLVLDTGYEALTLDCLLARAGVAKDVFDSSFSGLDDCFCAVLAKKRDEFLAAAAHGFATEGDRDWRDRIRGAAYGILRWLTEDMDRARFVFVEMLTGPPCAQLVRDQGMELLFNLIDQARNEPDARAGLGRETAEAVGGGIYTRLRLAVAKGDPEHLRALVPELMYTVVYPYLGKEAAELELRISPPELQSAR